MSLYWGIGDKIDNQVHLTVSHFYYVSINLTRDFEKKNIEVDGEYGWITVLYYGSLRS